MTFEQRFWAKVTRTAGCWLWIGARGGGGYGHISVDGRLEKAHRVSYQLHGGVIPHGLQLDHLCRVRHCVNPAHLEPVTNRENHRRRRLNACPNGHPYTADSTHWYRGYRTCRVCHSQRERERRARILSRVAQTA